MAVKIGFDETHNVLTPTLVLATRSGKKLGPIPATAITFTDNLVTYSELGFQVHKEDCSPEVWKQIKDLKLVWYKEANAWFELQAPIGDNTEVVKNCTATSLGVAELSQVNLYDIEINTEDDIARDAYIPTVLYDPSHPDGSLLHRIMEKVPHYEIVHVDASIRNIQRMFSFSDISIYDAFQKIAEEIKCLFDIKCYTDLDGILRRELYVYDLESHCDDCGYRGEFTETCPNCGSKNITEGVGEDTTIFVSTDALGENISYSCDVDAVKNCFRLEAGDDLMTVTVINCNPNGSPYIWYFSDDMYDDMPKELVEKIKEYQEKYDYYLTQYKAPVSADLIERYNALVDKYKSYNEQLGKIPAEIIGYPALMQAYYDTIDLDLFLDHSLMPDVEHQSTTAEIEAAKLNSTNLSPIAVSSLERVSAATAALTAQSMAKILVDYRYQVKVNEGYTLDGVVWTGSFTVTNYSDDEDTAVSATISLQLSDDYETYLRQKIDKAINDTDLVEDIYDIEDIFKLDNDKFAAEMKKYCLNRLSSFHDACQACLSVLIEQGAADKNTWGVGESSVYDNIYVPYREKLGLIEAEMKVREEELQVIRGINDADGNLTSDGVQTELIDIIADIADELNFEKFLGRDLWLIYSSYRRESTYSNDNYISDGLDNTEIFKNAMEFLETAQKEIKKSATAQHTITATLKNLLVMKEFRPIVEHFSVGNWIRVRVDEDIYKLRLTGYTITFDDLAYINVTFSDVVSNGDADVYDADNLVKQMQSVSSSYEAVERQASKGQQGADTIKGWTYEGFEVDNLSIMNNARDQDMKWDKNGVWLREYLTEFGDYDDRQLRIINRGLYLTDDGWITSKAAIGNFYYRNPKTGRLESKYGVNGELIVGQLILGNELGIYNGTQTLSFDEDGLTITNGRNTFSVSPNNTRMFNITKDGESLLYLDTDGELHISGNIFGGSININNKFLVNENGDVSILSGSIDIAGNYKVDNQGNVTITKGSINLGNNFTVDNQGNVNIKQGSININDKFTVNSSGYLTSTSGQIGGWSIGTNSLYNGTSSMSSNTRGTYLGTDGIRQYYNGSAYVNIQNGILSAQGANIHGDIYASGGTIGGWTIGSSAFYNGTSSMSSTTPGTYIGTNGIRQYASRSAYVNIQNGILTAQGASISGSIYASSGTVGGWTISANGLYNGTSSLYSTTPGVYLGTDGIRLYTDSDNYIDMQNGRISTVFASFEGDNSSNVNEATPWDVAATFAGNIYMLPHGSYSSTLYGAVNGSGNVALVYASGNYFSKTCAVLGFETPVRINGTEISMQSEPDWSSDRNLKKYIASMPPNYKNILHYLKPSMYRYNWEDDDSQLHAGYIAQDVLSALEAIGYKQGDIALVKGKDGEGQLSLAYTEFIPIFHLAILDIWDELAQLKDTVSKLSKE